MRSHLVFVATGKVNNRFLLCHLVRISSRRFHKAGAPIQETINKVLGLVSEQTSVGAGPVNNRADWEASFSKTVGRVNPIVSRRAVKVPAESLPPVEVAAQALAAM